MSCIYSLGADHQEKLVQLGMCCKWKKKKSCNNVDWMDPAAVMNLCALYADANSRDVKSTITLTPKTAVVHERSSLPRKWIRGEHNGTEIWQKVPALTLNARNRGVWRWRVSAMALSLSGA